MESITITLGNSKSQQEFTLRFYPPSPEPLVGSVFIKHTALSHAQVASI